MTYPSFPPAKLISPTAARAHCNLRTINQTIGSCEMSLSANSTPSHGLSGNEEESTNVTSPEADVRDGSGVPSGLSSIGQRDNGSSDDTLLPMDFPMRHCGDCRQLKGQSEEAQIVHWVQSHQEELVFTIRRQRKTLFAVCTGWNAKDYVCRTCYQVHSVGREPRTFYPQPRKPCAFCHHAAMAPRDAIIHGILAHHTAYIRRLHDTHRTLYVAPWRLGRECERCARLTPPVFGPRVFCAEPDELIEIGTAHQTARDHLITQHPPLSTSFTPRS